MLPTAANILSSELLWRLGIVAEFVATICVLGLVTIYFVLFSPVNRLGVLIQREMSLCLWLLIKGVNEEKWLQVAADAARREPLRV